MTTSFSDELDVHVCSSSAGCLISTTAMCTYVETEFATIMAAQSGRSSSFLRHDYHVSLIRSTLPEIG
jgi:hypothetical protein